MDKVWTQSTTILGMLLAVVMQTLLGFDVIPAEASDASKALSEHVVEVVRNIGVIVSVVGMRKAQGRVIVQTRGEGSS